jgi:Tn3 transposase DDE domain-containing protein
MPGSPVRKPQGLTGSDIPVIIVSQLTYRWLALTASSRRASKPLARAVFFNRLGELRDRTYENQQHQASDLNLVVATIALWNTVYLERAIRALQERSYVCEQQLLAHLSPLKWEHINLTGVYHWRRDGGLRNRKLRPLRSRPLVTDFAP